MIPESPIPLSQLIEEGIRSSQLRSQSGFGGISQPSTPTVNDEMAVARAKAQSWVRFVESRTSHMIMGWQHHEVQTKVASQGLSDSFSESSPHAQLYIDGALLSSALVLLNESPRRKSRRCFTEHCGVCG